MGMIVIYRIHNYFKTSQLAKIILFRISKLGVLYGVLPLTSLCELGLFRILAAECHSLMLDVANSSRLKHETC